MTIAARLESDRPETEDQDVDGREGTGPDRNANPAGKPHSHAYLTRESRLPIERIRFVPVADASTIGSIECGVLFLMAFWSGSSVLSFRRLTELVARRRAEIEVVVADVDHSPRLYDVLWGGVHGDGEVIWVRRGEIVALSLGPHAPDSFDQQLASLLVRPSANA